MKNRRYITCGHLFAAVFGMMHFIGAAELDLPAVFSDGMVLQQGMNVPVWGLGVPGTIVTVEFAGQKKTAITDSSSHWKLLLDPMPASSSPRKFQVSSCEFQVSFTNVLIGEVWLGSGQSNMEMRMIPFPPWHKGTLNFKEEVAAADYPDIRLFNIEKRASRQPEFSCTARWEPCGPETVAGFSAVGYFFARKLYKELGVPIGIINASWGSTAIESWMPKAALESSPDFKMILGTLAAALKENPPDLIKDFWLPTACYNGLIAPVVPYALRGVVWYQGEGNAAWPEIYEKLFSAMIESWRDIWGQAFPFYFVQLANFDVAGNPELTPGKWARLRQSQMAALSLPETGMAVAADIGDPKDIHPRNKQEVGRRLALWALANCYGRDVVFSGPLYRQMDIRGKSIVLQFDYVGEGLVAKSGSLGGFEVAGEDKHFYPALAVITNDTVIVHSPAVATPVAVRYGWTDNPVCSLYNQAGLPAAPFRTDSWDELSGLK